MYNTIDEIKVEIEKRSSYINTKYSCLYTFFKILKGLYDVLLYIGILWAIFVILNGYISWMWIFVCLLVMTMDHTIYRAIKSTIIRNRDYCKMDMILSIFRLYSKYDDLEEWEAKQIIEKDLCPIAELELSEEESIS